jgi:hypothetical protein
MEERHSGSEAIGPIVFFFLGQVIDEWRPSHFIDKIPGSDRNH